MAIPVQMFWPDDKKWYLIQIDSVDPRSRKAQCVSGPLMNAAVQSLAAQIKWVCPWPLGRAALQGAVRGRSRC